MNKKFILVLISLFILPFLTEVAHAEGEPWTGNINLFLGSKALKSSDWSPAENEGEFAVEGDFKQKSWPIYAVVGLRGASGSGNVLGSTFESKTSELSLGVRNYWNFPPYSIHPFLGGGLSDINAEADLTGFPSISGSALGYWLGGGIIWTLGEHFNLGLDLRVSSAMVTLNTVNVNAGGGHFGFLFGYHY